MWTTGSTTFLWVKQQKKNSPKNVTEISPRNWAGYFIKCKPVVLFRLTLASNAWDRAPHLNKWTNTELNITDRKSVV